MNEVKIHSPATVANVVCGFDVLGFALSEPFDEMILGKIDEKTVRIITRDDFNLPTEAEKNVAGVTLLEMLKAVNADFGFEVEITKHIKPGSGVGSSAASAAGAAFAANLLLGERFSKAELVEFARDGEFAACGSRIADNVSACIFGGFTLVRATEPTADIIPLEFPKLFATVIHPQIEIKTADAREILRKTVELKSAIRQWGNVAALVAGLQKGDYGLISRSLEDFLIEPTRKILIPKFDEIKAASLAAGALGGGISGSGPSIFMLSETLETAQKVGKTMREIYSQTEIEFNVYVSPINAEGVRMADK